MRPTVVTAAATPSSRRRLSKVDAGTGNPPISPRDAIAPRNCPNKPDRFKSIKSLSICPDVTAQWLKNTVYRSPFTLAGRGILGNRQRLCPGEVTPDLRVPLVRIAAELYRAIRFDVGSLVDNENRHRDGQCSPTGMTGSDSLVDRLQWLPEQHYRESPRVFDANAAVAHHARSGLEQDRKS